MLSTGVLERFVRKANVLSKNMAKKFSNDYGSREFNETIVLLALVGRWAILAKVRS